MKGATFTAAKTATLDTLVATLKEESARMMTLFGAPYAVAYASSKGGIMQMTRAMR